VRATLQRALQRVLTDNRSVSGSFGASASAHLHAHWACPRLNVFLLLHFSSPTCAAGLSTTTMPTVMSKPVKVQQSKAERDKTDKMYNEAMHLIERCDFEPAFVILRRIAERGHTDAQYNVDIMCANGRGVAEDQSCAAVLFTQAAARGHVEAQIWVSCTSAVEASPRTRVARSHSTIRPLRKDSL